MTPKAQIAHVWARACQIERQLFVERGALEKKDGAAEHSTGYSPVLGH